MRPLQLFSMTVTAPPLVRCRCLIGAALLLSLGWAEGADAQSGYRVSNYKGTIGGAPVHLSLQEICTDDDADERRYYGSYYYDRHSAPLALIGKDDGRRLTLCESENFHDVLAASSIALPCPFELSRKDRSLVGIWSNGGPRNSVVLERVGEIDTESDPIAMVGDTAIPAWQQSGRFAFLIRYGKVRTDPSHSRPVVEHVDVIDKENGDVFQRIHAAEFAGCHPGFNLSVIYWNFGVNRAGNELTLGCMTAPLRFRYSSDKDGVFRFNRVEGDFRGFE